MKCSKYQEEAITREDRMEELEIGGVISRSIILQIAKLDNSHIQNDSYKPLRFLSHYGSPVPVDDVVQQCVINAESKAVFWERA